MSITTEWANAHDTLISLALRGDEIEGAPEPVTADLALIFDPPGGGGLVIEGTTAELLRLLDFARYTVGTYDRDRGDRARDALADWDAFTAEHAALTDRAERGEIPYTVADEYEDDAYDKATTLAKALRTLAS